MTTLRLYEWSTTHVDPREWPQERREQLMRAVTAWRDDARLNGLPLSWSGADGCTLSARQWVGVVEAGNVTVEIYPKLDAALLDENDIGSEKIGSDTTPLLHSLLWMMEAAHFGSVAEAETASLADAPLSFADIWAYLLAKNLRRELQRGLSSSYIAHEDTLPNVRGRIRIGEQVSRHWNRFDRVACTWDEWTPDTPFNQLLKCACRVLERRVRDPIARGLLFDCVFLLGDVGDIAPETSLHATQNMVFTRATERFRLAFELARRILRGSGPSMGGGGDETWVFLLDMNKLFEDFCGVVLEKQFGVPIQTQHSMGTLLSQPIPLVRQFADYRWACDGKVFIADAKYKHLAKGEHSLFFSQIEDDRDAMLAHQVLDATDIRQLTTYAEMERRSSSRDAPHLIILYPFIGAGRFEIASATAWNGSPFSLIPVRLNALSSITDLVELLPPVGTEFATTPSLHFEYSK